MDLNSDEFPRIGFEVAEKGRTGMIPQQDLAEMDTVDFTRSEYVGGVHVRNALAARGKMVLEETPDQKE